MLQSVGFEEGAVVGEAGTFKIVFEFDDCLKKMDSYYNGLFRPLQKFKEFRSPP